MTSNILNSACVEYLKMMKWTQALGHFFWLNMNLTLKSFIHIVTYYRKSRNYEINQLAFRGNEINKIVVQKTFVIISTTTRYFLIRNNKNNTVNKISLRWRC